MKNASLFPRQHQIKFTFVVLKKRIWKLEIGAKSFEISRSIAQICKAGSGWPILKYVHRSSVDPEAPVLQNYKRIHNKLELALAQFEINNNRKLSATYFYDFRQSSGEMNHISLISLRPLVFFEKNKHKVVSLKHKLIWNCFHDIGGLLADVNNFLRSA